MEITGLPTPVFCGVDWAEDHHDIALVDAGGKQLAKVRIGDDAAGFSQLMALLAEHGDSEDAQIPVAIETSRGLLVACLRVTGRPVFAINPLAVARYRDRHSVARKKSDAVDAAALANILRTDMAAHRPLPPPAATARTPSPAAAPAWPGHLVRRAVQQVVPGQGVALQLARVDSRQERRGGRSRVRGDTDGDAGQAVELVFHQRRQEQQQLRRLTRALTELVPGDLGGDVAAVKYHGPGGVFGGNPHPVHLIIHAIQRTEGRGHPALPQCSRMHQTPELASE